MPTVVIGKNTGDDYSGYEDNWIDTDSPSYNMGSHGSGYCGPLGSRVLKSIHRWILEDIPDGADKIKVNKAGYSWSDTTLIVAGATSQTITGTASVITPPADSTLCRIGIYMKYQDGTIPATIESKLEVVELPDVHGNIGYMGTAYDGTYSATTGFLYWDVIQGAIAKLYILEAGIDGTKITIPATATAEIEDLI